MSGTIPPESRTWLRQAAATGGIYPQTILAIIERLEALESQRETEKAAILDVYELLDELKARADRHYVRIRALEGDAIQQPAQISEEENDRRFEACMAAIDAATPEQINSALEAAQQQPHKDKLDRLIEQDREDDEEPQTLHTIALRMVDSLEQLHVLPEILDTIRRAIKEPMEQPAPEAAPVATDNALLMMDGLEQLEAVQRGATKEAAKEAGRRAIYDLGREHGTAAAQPTPSAAPAGGLVERVAMAIGGDGDHWVNWMPEARRAIREVACWLRSELVSRRVAERLEQELEGQADG